MSLFAALPSAMDWYATLAEPSATADLGSPGRGRLHRYVDSPPELAQPALSETLICRHLGGDKHVRRRHGERLTLHEVALGSLTLMPAGQANRWRTLGPVDFVHLRLDQGLLDEAVREEFDRDPASLRLHDTVGLRDPLLEALFETLQSGIDAGRAPGRLHADGLLTVLATRLIVRHADLSDGRHVARNPLSAKGGLAPWRLRRVIDHMTAHLSDDVGLAALSALTGLSRAQFYRAFRESTGLSPHRYLTNLRLEAARSSMTRDSDVGALASGLGLPGAAQFSLLFKRRFGIGPEAYRRAL